MKYALTIGPASPAGESSFPVEASPEVSRNTPAKIRFRTVERPVIGDCQLDSLKVLALTLLREIDALEAEPQTAAPLNFAAIVQRFEAELIGSALIKTGGRLRAAARLLDMKVTTLHAKIRRYKLDLSKILPAAQVENLADETQAQTHVAKGNRRSEGSVTAIHSPQPRTRRLG
jgi:hypothetical protein